MRRNTQTQEGQGPQPSDTPNKINGLPARLRLKSLQSNGADHGIVRDFVADQEKRHQYQPRPRVAPDCRYKSWRVRYTVESSLI
jgi:hypothetical protein